MIDPERWSFPFTQAEMHRLWTYSDGALTVKGYRLPSGTARAGSWILVETATGNVQGMVPPGEFSRRFRPVDLFADVPRLPTYLGTVTASDGTALVDLVLDRNPFMLANGPRRVARPHALTPMPAERASLQGGQGPEDHCDLGGTVTPYADTIRNMSANASASGMSPGLKRRPAAGARTG
jgi:hypothetical protein